MKYFLSVCVCIKNERPYMAEFIRHYLAQGVDHLYLVDNGSTDGVETLPECDISTAAKETVTIVRDPRDFRILTDASSADGHRRLLTENLFERLRAETEWAIIVDADEFMFGKNGHTLKTYVQSLPQDVNRVYVFWNIISPTNDPVPETFHLAQNRRRINYDRLSDPALFGYHARFANHFGKSIFRPLQTRLPDGLWMHKVFVHGRAITNYGHEDDETTRYMDNLPAMAYSEEAYQKADVTLHHYALRNAADCDKKTAQLTAVVHKTPFILGLFDLLRHANPDAAFVTDTDLPTAAMTSALAVRHVCRLDTHRTLVEGIVGHLDVVRVAPTTTEEETAVAVQIVGWAFGLAGGAKRRRIRFVHGDRPAQTLDASVERNDVAQVYEDPELAPCGWDQCVDVVVVRDNETIAPGWLEMMNEDDACGWTRFMCVSF